MSNTFGDSKYFSDSCLDPIGAYWEQRDFFMRREKPVLEKSYQLTTGSSFIGRLAGRAVTVCLAIELHLVQILLVKVIFVVRSVATFIFCLYLLQKERDLNVIPITGIWLSKGTIRGVLMIVQLVALPIVLPIKIGKAIWSPLYFINEQLKIIEEHDERKGISLKSYLIQMDAEDKLLEILEYIKTDRNLNCELLKEIQKFEDNPTSQGIGRLKRKTSSVFHPDRHLSDPNYQDSLTYRYYCDAMTLLTQLEGVLPLFEKESDISADCRPSDMD